MEFATKSTANGLAPIRYWMEVEENFMQAPPSVQRDPDPWPNMCEEILKKTSALAKQTPIPLRLSEAPPSAPVNAAASKTEETPYTGTARTFGP
jgi:hypothetical protein